MHNVLKVILLLCLPGMFICNINAENTEYSLYIMEDQRYDQKTDIDKQISAGLLKQVMASLMLVESTRDFDKKMLVVYDFANPAYNAKTKYNLGDSLFVKEAYQLLLMEQCEDVYISTAVYMTETEKDFLDMMNKKAKTLGMSNTYFDKADNSVTTLRDIQILLSACQNNERIWQGMSIVNYRDSYGDIHQNQNLLKLGNVDAYYALSEPNSPFILIMNKEDYNFLFLSEHFDIKKSDLLIDKLSIYKEQPLYDKDEMIEIPIKGNLLNRSIRINAANDTIMLPYSIAESDMRFEIESLHQRAPIMKNNMIANINYYIGDEVVKVQGIRAEKNIYPLNQYVCIGLLFISVGFIEWLHRKKRGMDAK